MANVTEKYIDLRYPEVCGMGLILPLIPHEASWSRGSRATLYLIGLLYSFAGVAIVADIFMSAIEKITSKTRKIQISSGKDEPDFVEIKVWNDTVANLTLMALGSSAPEILLSIIEIVGNNFVAGDLGPGTIVGSAAFNLLAIAGVCIIAIPNGEVRTIKYIKVFGVTSIFSLFAYIWLLVVLMLISPNVVELWEAILTLLFFPILVLLAWWADRDWKFGKRPVVSDQQIELGNGTQGVGNGKAGGGRPDSGDAMISTKHKMFYANGELNKEGVIDFYKDLQRFNLSDSDAALLAATKLIDEQPKSRMWYRIGAVRGMAGSRKIQPALSEKLQEVYDTINSHPDVPDIGPVPSDMSAADESKAIIEFSTASFACLENVGKFPVTVLRHGKMDNTVRVKVESFDGSAKAGSDYLPVNEILTFGPYTKDREVLVNIIDDNQWEPDEEFFLRLTILDEGYKRRDVGLGKLPIMEIVILNDDEPGTLQFKRRGVLVKESCKFAALEVERVNGADGEITVKWKTLEETAKDGKDFQGGEGVLEFKHGEILKCIEIPIVNDLKPERDECFEVEIFEPSGGAKLGRISKVSVTISNDDEFDNMLSRMMAMTTQNLKNMTVHHETWASQIQDAFMVNGGNIEEAGKFDYVFHFITFGWKTIFSLIPPPSICGGWLCFFTSLAVIGVLTAVVGDLASIFGCLIGLHDTVTAITFVALGTSLPDLFASKTACLMEKHADNAIGNVTGSNSVNVFLGLGLPWVLAAVYWTAQGGEFEVPSGSLGFSVIVYSTVAFIGLSLLMVRRYSAYFGNAELGGPTIPKYISGGILFSLWFVYIILSSLQTYGHIKVDF